MESSTKKGVVAIVVIAVAILGYSQYASVSHITVSGTQSELLRTDGGSSDYSIELEVENPSLLALTAGQTKFYIESGGAAIGEGTLEPFTLTPLNEITVNGTYRTWQPAEDAKGDGEIRLTGVTEYDALFTSIQIPFVYHPTDEQAMNFIHQG